MSYLTAEQITEQIPPAIRAHIEAIIRPSYWSPYPPGSNALGSIIAWAESIHGKGLKSAGFVSMLLKKDSMIRAHAQEAWGNRSGDWCLLHTKELERFGGHEEFRKMIQARYPY